MDNFLSYPQKLLIEFLCPTVIFLKILESASWSRSPSKIKIYKDWYRTGASHTPNPPENSAKFADKFSSYPANTQNENIINHRQPWRR